MLGLEQILGVIEGIGDYPYDRIYDIYFTDLRLIVVPIIRPMDFVDIYTKRRATDLLFGMGWRRHEVRQKSRTITNERRSKLKGRTPSEIVKAMEGSFEIPHVSVISAEAKSGILGSSLRIVSKGARGKRKLSFPLSRDQLEKAKNLIESIRGR